MAGCGPRLPDEDALLEDLKTLRRRGITTLSRLDLPALRQVVRASGRVGDDEKIGAFMIEAMLRDAVAQIGGDDGDTAALILGLEEGGRSERPAALRQEAIETSGVGKTRFRQAYEPRMFNQAAQLLLREAHSYQLRLARLRSDVRTPVGSRLAVEWLARFQAMYRIWTPVTGLGADLTAYRATLLNEDRPWDREPDPDNPQDTGYSQELQAAGYANHALYHLARVLSTERSFITEFGGLWLLPDAQAETDIADALYRIGLATPNNERDDSYLRGLLNRTDDELHRFLELITTEEPGIGIHEEWHDWISTCDCSWDHGQRHSREFFPTHRNHPNISNQCDMHTLIAACSDFCLILDDAWDQIADWYHDIPKPARDDVTAEDIYAQRQNPLPKHLSNANRRQASLSDDTD